MFCMANLIKVIRRHVPVCFFATVVVHVHAGLGKAWRWELERDQ